MLYQEIYTIAIFDLELLILDWNKNFLLDNQTLLLQFPRKTLSVS